MADFFLRPKAREDLEDIWFYTHENWGEDQADSYIHDLDSGFRALAVKPEKGRPCDDVRLGYLKYLVGNTLFFIGWPKKELRSSAFFTKEWTRNSIFKPRPPQSYFSG